MFCAGPCTSEWIKSSWFRLRFRSLGNGSRCCFPSTQASQTWPLWPLNFGKLKMIFFVRISRRCGKLTWANRLCHRSIFDSAFCPFANIAVPTSFVSRINILRSWCPCAMTFPSSSMKHSRCVNRTCIHWSTIYLTDVRFFVIVGTCMTFINFPFCLTWFKGTSPTC